MSALRSSQLGQEREKYRASIAEALEEDEDPLAAYDDFIKWTSRTFSGNDPASGLVQLLEEATRKFKDDERYRGDLRYLKLWCSFAKIVEKPSVVYAYLVKREIGCVYALLWEEYAMALEKEGRRSDAEKTFRAGISRSARPMERLKKRYRDFQSRPPTSKPQSTPFKPSGSNEVDAIRRNPFKNHDPAAASSHNASASASASAAPLASNSTSSPNHGRYAPMLAPPAPGRRPEKLRFNLSLLFTPSGVEYSGPEVRSRSMGLLGKKWGPPPASELRSSLSDSVRVNFNDDGSRSTQNMGGGGRRKSVSVLGEPTVTINTKEALADVFGMYNSPDKTVKRAVPGSKHAPVRKIELTGGGRVVSESRIARATEHARPSVQSANENAKTPGMSFFPFKPFVDENSSRKENSTPAAKFKPFVDEQKHPLVTPTPETGRRALSLKESSALTSKDTGPTTKSSNLDASKPPLKSISEEPQGLPVFSKPFTPVSQKEPLVRPSQTKLGSEDAPEGQGQIQGQGQAFVPFVDSKTPFKVFSRPPGLGQGENGGIGGGNVFTPKPPAASAETFKPFVDDAAQPSIPSNTPASSRKANALQPRAIPIPPIIEETSTDESSEADLGAGDNVVGSGSVNNLSESEDGYAYDGGEAEAEADAAIVSSSDSQFDEEEEGQSQHAFGGDQEREDAFRDDRDADAEEEDDEEYQQPLGGRFGRINVMTPITERTFEFSTRGFPTPTRRESGRHALEVAEKLARELRGEEDEDEDYQDSRGGPDYGGPAAQVDGVKETLEERTGTLSLSDSLAVVSAFRPSNPCNPFDPAIISTLLSLLPADEDFHDLRAKEGGILDGLQKYAAQKARSSGKGSGPEDDGVLVTLEGRKLRVLEKLGEGGFGAVFSARDIPSKSSVDDEDEDEDDDDDDDDEDANSMLALKVVKPRNLWEFHVLRRIHRTLPAPLTRSIILPHALYAFRDESHLLLQLCPHGTLLDAVNRAGPAGISQQGACLDELLVFFFTIELLRFIEGMHSSGYIHGDLKIDNCLVRLEDLPGGASSLSGMYQASGEGGWRYRGIKVIDFGRTIDTSLFPAGHNQRFVGDWPTDDRDCFEIREGRPWTYQTDYFGLAGIVYCMLFGKYIEASSVTLGPQSTESNPVYKIATPFKRYWQTDILTRLFDMLLNPGRVRADGKLPICEELSGIRAEMEAWLQSNCNRSSNTLKGLLKKIELSVYIR
ncbi:Mad3/BUB1 homology region 1-domain-containing protein [Phlebopus sp. FC_14]|nr:Mad3/BUB1 homology region 1-domain-containing protein [Phlebopus sp. FC_14]